MDDYDENRSDVLLEVEVPVVTNQQCNATDDMICAGGEAGKDACKVYLILNLNKI